jgi:hypothetical protein
VHLGSGRIRQHQGAPRTQGRVRQPSCVAVERPSVKEGDCHHHAYEIRPNPQGAPAQFTPAPEGHPPGARCIVRYRLWNICRNAQATTERRPESLHV